MRAAASVFWMTRIRKAGWALEGVLRRCLQIIKAEKINFSDDQKQAFTQMVRANYPDIRKCINDIQKFSLKGSLQIPAECDNDFVEGLYKLIKAKRDSELRKYIITNEGQINSDYIHLLRSLFNYIDKKETNDQYKKMALLVIAEHIYRASFIADQEINAYACCINLITL